MILDMIRGNKSASKVARKAGRSSKAMSDYRRIEYANEWGAGNRMRPVFPLNCDARIKYGI